jgi:ATP-dependent exoDNAse (exonuclease V) alpha subunit
MVLMLSVMIHEATNRKSTRTTLKVYVLQKVEMLKQNKEARAKEMKKKSAGQIFPNTSPPRLSLFSSETDNKPHSPEISRS